MGLLAGRTALVTGGSRGLGRAICVALAREGAAVAFNYSKDEEAAAETLRGIEACGVRGWSFKVSVLDRVGMQALVKQLPQF